MIEDVSLENFKYIFQDPKLKDLRKINFIYGKNGTGKSTIVSALQQQYSQEYDILIFNGFHSILKDDSQLDAIILGETNVEIDNQVKILDKEINNYKNKIDELNIELESKTTVVNKLKNNIASLETEGARIVTEKLNFGRTYNKNNFHTDYVDKKALDKNRVEELEKTLISEEKELQIISNKKLTINSNKLIENVNKLLTRQVSPSIVLAEFVENDEKMQFALQGMQIHSRRKNEKCAFCNNIITEQRWMELDEYFSDKFKKFSEELQAALNEIKYLRDEISCIKELNSNNFYPEFSQNVNKNNNQLVKLKNNWLLLLNRISDALESRINNLFQPTETLKLESLDSFSDILNEQEKLICENSNYHNSLESKKLEAKNLLKFNYISEFATEKDLETKVQHLAVLESELNEFNDMIEKNVQFKDELIKNREVLINKTRNEQIAADRINKILKNHVRIGFELNPIHDKGTSQGAYQIRNLDEKNRFVVFKRLVMVKKI